MNTTKTSTSAISRILSARFEKSTTYGRPGRGGRFTTAGYTVELATNDTIFVSHEKASADSYDRDIVMAHLRAYAASLKNKGYLVHIDATHSVPVAIVTGKAA